MSWNFRSTLEQLGELYYKYLKTCLKIYKPHFFVEYIEKISDNIDGNDEDDCCYNYYNQYRMRQIKVLDTEKNIKKMLIVFQTDCDREEKLITFKEIFTSLGRSDLVLDLYDSYFLDPESTFYVFEMECYDLTSDALLNKCIVPVHQLRKIVQKQLNCIFKLLRLDLQDNQADAPLYINLLNQNQIQVKLNLFDFYEQIQSLLDESYDGKKKQINEYDNEILQAANIDENLIIAINQQLSEYEQNTFLPQSKQKFLEKILSMNQKDQKEHCLKIFEMISQHPQYNNFQIIQIQKEYFELQLEKLNKTILLIGIKFDAANEALKMENEYKQLYLLSGKFKSYLIDTQTFQLENCIYLLLEFEKINDTEANQSIRLSDYTYEKDREAFDFLQMLIEISYELYLKYNIKLTDIDPYEILIQQNMQQGINQILIDRFNFKNCCKEYIKLISRCFERFNKYYDKLQKQYFNGNINYDNNHYHSILSYLQMVSNDTIKNINEIQKQYQNITKMLELLQTAIELKENNQYFYAYICQYNPYKLSVDLKNYFSTGKQLELSKNIFELLMKNQEKINKLKLKTNHAYSKILNELRDQKQRSQLNQLPQQNQPFQIQVFQQNQSFQQNQLSLNQPPLSNEPFQQNQQNYQLSQQNQPFQNNQLFQSQPPLWNESQNQPFQCQVFQQNQPFQQNQLSLNQPPLSNEPFQQNQQNYQLSQQNQPFQNNQLLFQSQPPLWNESFQQNYQLSQQNLPFQKNQLFQCQAPLWNQPFQQNQSFHQLSQQNQPFLQNQLPQKLLFQGNEISLFSQNKQDQSKEFYQKQSSLFHKQILEEIGLSNAQDYNCYNIGLSICKFLKNLKILCLEFDERFNFEIINEDSNFLKLSDQILRLDLIFNSKNEYLINLISQLQQYKNLNTLSIEINEFKIKMIERIVKKSKRLVNIKVIQKNIYKTIEIDQKLGFFF